MQVEHCLFCILHNILTQVENLVPVKSADDKLVIF